MGGAKKPRITSEKDGRRVGGLNGLLRVLHFQGHLEKPKNEGVGAGEGVKKKQARGTSRGRNHRTHVLGGKQKKKGTIGHQRENNSHWGWSPTL